MYSKEQVATRLKLGSTLSTAELALVVKSLMEDLSKLEEKYKTLEGKYDELSKDRRGTDINSGEAIQATPIRPFFKQR